MVIDGRSHPTVFPHHLHKILISLDAIGLSIEVGAGQGVHQAHSLHLDVTPVVRVPRRLRGLHRVTDDDVLSGHRRADEVAISTWPVELWQDHRRARFEHPRGPSSVPLGSLVSRSHPWLGMAGRCLSATHEALGALRVIGTALATGEAIGVAAALAADRGSGLDSIAALDVRNHILEQSEKGSAT